MKQLATLQKLVRELQKIPYLASKNIYRVAFYFLQADEQSVGYLCDAIMHARKAIKPCKDCYNWAEEQDLCVICSDAKRDASIICVVETWHDLFAIEKVGEFFGKYHVLGGVLCPLEGVGAQELYLERLFQRCKDSAIKEIIFATNPTPEGEATASYIATKITRKDIVLSKLASGVPVGSNLAFMDRITIAKSLIGRRPF